MVDFHIFYVSTLDSRLRGNDRKESSVIHSISIMKNVSTIIGLIILILTLGCAFYWYEWRPYYIRRECVKISSKLNSSSIPDADLKNYLLAREDLYKMCVRAKGIEN